jgi:hypothetical protein
MNRVASRLSAKSFFDALSNSLQRFHVHNVNAAKTDETRARRIDKAVALSSLVNSGRPEACEGDQEVNDNTIERPEGSGPTPYFPSIERTYGQPAGHRFSLLDGAGEKRRKEYVTLLKTEHGIGHGHANALVGHWLGRR